MMLVSRLSHSPVYSEATTTKKSPLQEHIGKTLHFLTFHFTVFFFFLSPGRILAVLVALFIFFLGVSLHNENTEAAFRTRPLHIHLKCARQPHKLNASAVNAHVEGTVTRWRPGL